MKHISVLLMLLVVIVAGCSAPPAMTTIEPTNPTTNPTVLATTRPSYWMRQPATTQVRYGDFRVLWNACEEAARELGFSIDREDYRNGTLTTYPLISAQFFEFWRGDVNTFADAANSNLATYRRTVTYQFQREPGGGYLVTPCAVIERRTMAEQPISDAIYARTSLGTIKHPAQGTHETDREIYLPRTYWYATGRDSVLEKKLDGIVEKKLRAD